MDDLPGVPVRLLYQLAQGQLTEEELDLVEAMLRAEGLDACPPEVQRRAAQLAELHLRAREALERPVQPARPVFDSWSAPRLAGVRGHGGSSRQLLLHGPEAEISLHVQPVGIGHLRLIGQVFGPARSSGEALLLRANAPAIGGEAGTAIAGAIEYGPVAVDDLGEFMFAQIHAGRYILQVQLGAQRIDSIALALSGDLSEGDPELDH